MTAWQFAGDMNTIGFSALVGIGYSCLNMAWMELAVEYSMARSGRISFVSQNSSSQWPGWCQ